MPKVRVASFAVSLDGYGAGPNQDLEHPLGVGGERLMEWFVPTHVWQSMHEGGGDVGETGASTTRWQKSPSFGSTCRPV